MRLLFTMDLKDYTDTTRAFVRHSARSIIIKDHKVAMIHSLLYDHYKFPGGGMEENEDPVETMIRETREEAGLIVIPESIKEYGYVHRIQKSDHEDAECFIQDNYYYLCDVRKESVPQQLDAYEAKEKYTLEYVDPLLVIEKNRNNQSPYSDLMLEREARVLELLLQEGLFD